VLNNLVYFFLFIPKEDIIFMYKNVKDINKIKKYINNKMKISR